MLWFVVLACLPLLGCAPKAPLPPPQYEDPNRAPSGAPSIESAIFEAIELQQVGDDEYARLTRSAADPKVEETILRRYLMVAVDRGDLNQAARVLLERALISPGDEGPIADAFGMVMGHLQWETCANLAREFLLRKAIPGVFAVRALCLERAGKPEEATENLLAAHQVLNFELDGLERIGKAVRARGAAGQMEPAEKELYDQLLQDVTRRGMTDLLFVQHLTGVFDPALGVGTLTVGGMAPGDVKAVLLSRASSYRYCQESLAYDHRREKSATPLAGSAKAQFTIGPLGQVRDIQWQDVDWAAHPAGKQLTQCLTTQLQRLQFPAPRFGRPRLAAHEFRFAE